MAVSGRVQLPAIKLTTPSIGPRLRARALPGQHGEVAIAAEALTRLIRTAKPVSGRTA